MRKCSVCGKEMESGWVLYDGLKYACSLDCLHSIVPQKEYSELYEAGEAYYTTWEDEKDEEDEEIDLYDFYEEEIDHYVSCRIIFYLKMTNPRSTSSQYIHEFALMRDTPENILKYANNVRRNYEYVGYNFVFTEENEIEKLLAKERIGKIPSKWKEFTVTTVRNHSIDTMYTTKTYCGILKMLETDPYTTDYPRIVTFGSGVILN